MFSLPFGSDQSLSTILLIPAIVAIFAILFIGSLLVSEAKPEAVGKAITCYILKAVGVILLVIGGMQLLYSLFTLNVPETKTLLALALLIVIGIGILVHESRVIEKLNDASVIVSRMVFGYSCVILGTLAALFSLLTFLISFIVTQELGQWESTATVVITGTVLTMLSSAYAAKKGKTSAKKKK